MDGVLAVLDGAWVVESTPQQKANGNRVPAPDRKRFPF
jgi:hypothetical protein